MRISYRGRRSVNGGGVEGVSDAIFALRDWYSNDLESLLRIAGVLFFAVLVGIAFLPNGVIASWVQARPKMRELKQAEKSLKSDVQHFRGNRRARRAAAAEARRLKGGRP